MKYLASAGPEQVTFDNPFKGGVENLPALISNILEIVVQLGAIVIVFFIIYSGFLFVTAQGNEKKLETAKLNLLYVAIGTVILLGAQVLASILGSTVKEITGR